MANEWELPELEAVFLWFREALAPFASVEDSRMIELISAFNLVSSPAFCCETRLLFDGLSACRSEQRRDSVHLE